MSNHPLNKPSAYRNRLDGYRAEADTLLAEYGLDVRDAAVEALAKRIMFERFRDDYEAEARFSAKASTAPPSTSRRAAATRCGSGDWSLQYSR